MILKRFVEPLVEYSATETDEILLYSDFLVDGDYDYSDAEWLE